MDKVAMVKQAEVQGVLAGLVDAGYIKLASQEDFDTVCDIVTENISDKDWTFDEVVEKTAEVMDEVYKVYDEQGLLEKEAGEVEYTDADVMAAIGELTLAKEAGEVSGEEADSKMKKLKNMLMANKGKVVGGAALAALLGAGAYKHKAIGAYAKDLKDIGGVNALRKIRYDAAGGLGKAWAATSAAPGKALSAVVDAPKNLGDKIDKFKESRIIADKVKKKMGGKARI